MYAVISEGKVLQHCAKPMYMMIDPESKKPVKTTKPKANCIAVNRILYNLRGYEKVMWKATLINEDDKVVAKGPVIAPEAFAITYDKLSKVLGIKPEEVADLKEIPEDKFSVLLSK